MVSFVVIAHRFGAGLPKECAAHQNGAFTATCTKMVQVRSSGARLDIPVVMRILWLNSRLSKER
jgi:hypothetical protein